LCSNKPSFHYRVGFFDFQATLLKCDRDHGHQHERVRVLQLQADHTAKVWNGIFELAQHGNIAAIPGKRCAILHREVMRQELQVTLQELHRPNA
jgi:hypothetical protein